MKTILMRLWLLCALAAGMCACQSFLRDGRTSLGRPYEMLVICPQAEWDGAVGESIRSLLGASIPRMNTPEHYFDINHSTKQGMNDLLNKQSNILTVSFDAERSDTRMLVQYDYTAKPQIIVSLKAPSPEAAVEYLSENGESLMRVFEMAERERDLALFERLRDDAASDIFREYTGLGMTVLQGYKRANTVDDSILWLRKDYNRMSQDIFAFTYPCTDRTDLTAEWLVRAIDNRLAKIPGGLLHADGKGYRADILDVQDRRPLLVRAARTVGAGRQCRRQLHGRPVRQLFDHRYADGRDNDYRLFGLCSRTGQARLYPRNGASDIYDRIAVLRALRDFVACICCPNVLQGRWP